MSKKTIVTATLLMFVGASVAVLVIKEIRARQDIAQAPAGNSNEPTGVEADAPAKGRQVVAYYFHRKQRCDTCNTIERLAREVVDTDFAEDLQSKRLTWRTVCFQLPENEAYREQLDVHTPSIVLVETVDGKIRDSVALPDVWQLWTNEPAFKDYVRGEIADWLKG